MKKRNKLSSISFVNARITATISITFVLFILGLIILLPIISNNFSKHIKEQLSFDIILQDNMTEKQIKALETKINKAPFSKSTKYISKEDAAKNIETELGMNPEEFLGFNPLPAVIEVHLNSDYVNTDSIQVVELFLASYTSDINAIEYKKELMQKLSENMAKIGFILLIVVIPLLFISFALISNTIRLMVYSKRFLIHTMQLVGAKRSFIRKPFIMANVWTGVLAAIIADGLLLALIYYLTKDILLANQFLDINSLTIVFGSVIILGVITSIIATYFAVNRYISANVDDLYKM
ncbi:cell division transport system permease protein [Dysgonomonadaceae bacterium PH5-43]|nr:cell division transport system permease protein [Dysgonomonadaceae bacterium PH5-43]